jgi:5-methylcytosine-specific restriction endonuclease McrA
LERRLAARFPEADAEEFVRARRGRAKPLSAERFALQVTISESAHAQLQRALELMSHESPERSLEPVIERALDLLVEKLERARRAKTVRPTRAGAGEGKGAASRVATSVNGNAEDRVDAETRAVGGANQKKQDPTRAGAAKSRRSRARRAIPRAVQRQVFERDGAACSFVGENGRRCASRGCLELDHVTPWALGGASSAANLRVLCRAHNRLAAEEWFGRGPGQAAAAARSQPSTASALTDFAWPSRP